MRISWLLLLIACNSPSGEPTGRTAGLWGPFNAIRQAVKLDLARSNASGAQVAIWSKGEVIFSEGFGTRDPATHDPVDTDTVFQFASDEKKLTAIGLLQQVAAGRVSLDDTLSQALPDLHFALDPSWSDQITVRELLSHQTGLYDYWPIEDDPDDARLAGRAYGRFATHEYDMGSPGVFWDYSNSNYSLAGLIAEHASGTMWPDLMERDVYGPLGMTRTFPRLSEVKADGDYAVGTGYSYPDGYDEFHSYGSSVTWTWGRVDMADQFDNAWDRPPGLVWTTAEDMTKVAAFLVDGDPAVLPDVLREQISTPHAAWIPGIDPNDLGYGFGLFIGTGWSVGGEAYMMPVWMHGGGAPAMTSTFWILPSERLAVCILSNGYDGHFDDSVFTAFLNLADLPDPVPLTGSPTLYIPSLVSPPLPPADGLDAYAGTWKDPYSVGTVTLTWDGANLTVAMPDLAAAGYIVEPAVTPAGRDVFTVKVRDPNNPFVGDASLLDLRFYDGPNGEPHRYMVNRLFVATRSTDRAAAPPPAHPLRPTDFTRPRLDPTLGLLDPDGADD